MAAYPFRGTGPPSQSVAQVPDTLHFCLESPLKNFSLPRVLLAGLVAGSSVSAYAQPAPLKVEKLAYKGNMPFVESTGTPASAAAARINQAMYLDVLQKAAPATRREGLRSAPSGREPGGPDPVSELSYQVHRLDARLLSLSVGFQGCGAYCENQTAPFTFDVRNGREVTATLLFTPAGFTAIRSQVDRLQQTRVRNHLAKLKSADKARSGKAGTAPAEDEDAEARIELFESCLKSLQDPERHRFSYADEEAFYVMPEQIVFSRGRCSNHAARALDELGDFNAPLGVSVLLPHLTAYGKYLLQGGAEVAPPATPLRSVLKGKVGTAPITLRLRSPGYEQSVSGYYFYDRFRTPIPLFGKLKDGVMELAEEVPEGKEAPVLTLRIQGDGVKGEWAGGGKRLPVVAAP